MDVAKAIVKGLNYRGWVSMELFSRTMNEPGKGVPVSRAERARKSWEKFLAEISAWGIEYEL